ncbi:MAG TPA: endolytic transglycosylase MltG [Candidatus Gemmiger faecigallinarum]|nr:endolytic transglycosylase MltG [Candidatus Gemmiger faecigallinarum]
MRIQRNDGNNDASRRVYHARPQMQPAEQPVQPEPEAADGADEDDEEPEKPRRRFPVGLVIVLLVAVLLGVGGWQVMQLYGEVDGSLTGGVLGDAVTIEIEEGATATQIAGQLAEAGVIQHDWLFRLYAQSSGRASDLQPGPVELRSGMSYNAILQAISQQRVFRSTVRITVPEGTTAVAVAQLMEENGLCTAEDFLACANGDVYTEKADSSGSNGGEKQADFSDYDFWNQIPDNEGRLLRCEGYLFPETYEFFTDDTIENYVRTFYDQFESETEGLMELVDANTSDCINSLDDAVILASFIQEEAGLAAEDAKVSACFHNRLESSDPLWADHRLESNASSYIINDEENNYLWNSPIADYMGWRETGAIPEDVLNAYDTYRISGLPAGAISNPGIDAINAALNPDQEYLSEGYFFFVTGNPDGEYHGQYFYAKTADEHAANVQTAGWG